MRGTSGKYALCFENFESALAEYTKTYGHIDLLCAGWPCQGNSTVGKRKGMLDSRSGLWKEVARVLGLFKPQWFLGENVPGLLSVNGGTDFQKILSDFMEIGYGVSWRILNSQYFGVPQRRRRIYIVGYFGDICPPEILFEQKGGFGNDTQRKKKRHERGSKGICFSTRDGERHEAAAENYVSFTIKAAIRGNPRFIWQDTHIAEANPIGKGEVAGISRRMDGLRGVVLGNAVSVPVAEWIGKRIMDYEK